MQLSVILSNSQEHELQNLVAHHPKAYIREKAVRVSQVYWLEKDWA